MTLFPSNLFYTYGNGTYILRPLFLLCDCFFYFRFFSRCDWLFPSKDLLFPMNFHISMWFSHDNNGSNDDQLMPSIQSNCTIDSQRFFQSNMRNSTRFHIGEQPHMHAAINRFTAKPIIMKPENAFARYYVNSSPWMENICSCINTSMRVRLKWILKIDSVWRRQFLQLSCNFFIIFIGFFLG